MGMPGQEHRRLSGRVGAADDVDVVSGARRCLRHRRAVEQPPPGQPFRPGHVEPAIRDAGRQQDGVGHHLAAVGEPDRSRGRPHVEADDVARGQDLGAELVGLPPGPVGELAARHPVRESQVVLDPGALARLAARGLALDQDGA